MVSPDLIDRALRRFLVLGQAMRRDAETLPVSVAQSAVLSRPRGGPKTVGELAVAEGVRAPSMTQIINRMEEAGWVTRSEGPVRGRTVRITEAGLAVAVAVRQERAARLARRCDGLSAGDLAALEPRHAGRRRHPRPLRSHRHRTRHEVNPAAFELGYGPTIVDNSG